MTSARPDTRFLAVTTLATDLGQRLTNLTAAAPGAYEANSARTALTGAGAGRAIELACSMTNASTGVLVDHGTGASYRIRVTAGGVVEFRNSVGLIGSITAPGIAAGSQNYVIAWSTEPNPLTTGAGDALRSEFTVYGGAAGSETVERSAVTHATVAASSTGTFTVGGVYTGGALTLAFDGTITAVRISSRFHTGVETREHFVAPTAAPTLIGIAACQQPPFPAGALEPGHIVGPAYQAAASSMKIGRNRHRLCSPLVQCIIAVPLSVADRMQDVYTPGHIWSMGDGWQTPLGLRWYREVPRHVQWLRVEVQWATWETAPGATDLVELRVHSANNRLIKQATKTSEQLISRQVDDGTNGLGVRQVFDPLFVERDENGYTAIYLSARTDSGSGSGNATYSIRGVSVIPWVLDEGYDGVAPAAFGG